MKANGLWAVLLSETEEFYNNIQASISSFLAQVPQVFENLDPEQNRPAIGVAK